MAGRNFRSNRIYNWHVFGAHLDGRASIGSSGAPTLITSSTVPSSSPAATQQQSVGIKSITRLATGTYRLQLDDNYASLYSFDAFFTGAVTGSDIPVDATTVGLTVGVTYQITAVGTATTAANYVTLGVPIGITPAVGVVFTALTTGTGTQSGAGTVKALTGSGISKTQLYGIPDLMLNNQPFVQGSGGGFITFQTIASTPVGTVAAPVFTGSALGTHTHSFTPAGTNDGGTPPLFTGTPGTTGATSGGTPAGTNSAPAFTGTAPVAADPTNGCTMYFRMLLGNSSLS